MNNGILLRMDLLRGGNHGILTEIAMYTVCTKKGYTSAGNV